MPGPAKSLAIFSISFLLTVRGVSLAEMLLVVERKMVILSGGRCCFQTSMGFSVDYRPIA